LTKIGQLSILLNFAHCMCALLKAVQLAGVVCIVRVVYIVFAVYYVLQDQDE